MPSDTPEPKSIPQVMVSSTFTDLKEHRAALIDQISRHGLYPKVMEHDSAKLTDLIDSSLQMVRDSAAYVLIISHRYGQIPECPARNPDQRSITELEFDEALRLGRPIFLFVMGDDYRITEATIERVKAMFEHDVERQEKLQAFRERAKQMGVDNKVQRIYAQFDSLKEFEKQIAAPLAELKQHLAKPAATPSSAPRPKIKDAIPSPPALYAEPDYIGSHPFVGRRAQLEELDDWARAADPSNLIFFEAIGGNGKSMLTWRWINHHATQVRSDWAGRFWYSFYERGALMTDFCRRALAYMTAQPLEQLKKLPMPELIDQLIAELHAKPWLLVLDGLERVLVAYHRIDAAELPDEQADHATDQILHRDPCDAIRDQDADLLRHLVACRPSKVLVSSRLTPRVLINKSGQPIQGVKRVQLAGLRSEDAEQMLRDCGVRGDSNAIQDYLTRNCDNHPLVIGVLGGLIANFLPARGDFDAWAASAGAELNLAQLDLVQRRNHILSAALQSVSIKGRELLQTLALISDAVDYSTLQALSPHQHTDAEDLSPVPQGEQALGVTIKDLEQRGLLQYDHNCQRYDLHPVVRGVVVGNIDGQRKNQLGQRVVDHFSSLAHDPYESAQTLEELSVGLNLVRALLRIGRFQEAADAYQGDLAHALLFNVEAHAETLELLRPYFLQGWSQLPGELEVSDASYLANEAAFALFGVGEYETALGAYAATLKAELDSADWQELNTRLRNVAISIWKLNRYADASRISTLALELAEERGDKAVIFRGRLDLFLDQSLFGQWQAAEQTWSQLDPMGRAWHRAVYRQGDAEYYFASAKFWQGKLQHSDLDRAESLARADNNRKTLRDLQRLRGQWRLEQHDWAGAVGAFHEALRMARERRLSDPRAEAGLLFAKLQLQHIQPEQARDQAERLIEQREPHHRYLAMLWQHLGDLPQAKRQALAAYRKAWADGEPYVLRYELNKAAELLESLGEPIPQLPDYDPSKAEPFPWEADVREVIEKLRAEKQRIRLWLCSLVSVVIFLSPIRPKRSRWRTSVNISRRSRKRRWPSVVEAVSIER